MPSLRARSGVLASVLSMGLACGGGDGDAEPPAEPSPTPPATAAKTCDPAQAIPAPGTRIWTDASARVEIGEAAWMQGRMRFAADRGALTDAQRMALEGLAIAPIAETTCWSDLGGAGITVTDSGGTSRSYRANSKNDTCLGTESCANLVSYDSYAQLRATLGCRYVQPPHSGGARESAVTISPADGCWHSVMASGVGGWLSFDVKDDTPYSVEVGDCGWSNKLVVDLFREAETVSVATSGPVGATCPVLAVPDLGPGRWFVRVKDTDLSFGITLRVARRSP